jgi:hypothetical protein
VDLVPERSRRRIICMSPARPAVRRCR